MRKISGKLLSSKPISLPLAAKRLSSFTALENGASAAVSIYLQRSADAFNNLVQFHEQNKPIKNQIKKENLIDDEKSINIENYDVKEEKKNKRKKKKKKSDDDDDDDVVQVKQEELEIENVEKTNKVVKKEEISLDEEKQEKKTRRKNKRKISDGVGMTVEVKKEVD